VNKHYPVQFKADAVALCRSRPGATIAASRSQTSVRGHPPQSAMTSHIPAKMSPARRDGIITASVTRECPHVIASTGNTRC
jgi:hypothetical protein